MTKINTLKSFKSKSLNGIINVPGDKSISQSALIFASLCYGLVKINAAHRTYTYNIMCAIHITVPCR